MPTPDAVSRFRAFVARFNAGDPDAIRDAIAAEFFTHVPASEEPSATETWDVLTKELRSGFPDLQVSVDRLAPSADADVLSGQVTVAGTHTGQLWGVPPTGAVISWPSPSAFGPWATASP